MNSQKNLLKREQIEEGVRLILQGLNCDLNDENFKDTPRRVADMLEEFILGNKYEEEPVRFTQQSDLVIISDIQSFSFCPHHLLPVVYNTSIAYIPKGKVVGVSKPVRVVYDATSQLILQEDATELIAENLIKLTESEDVMVTMRGEHFCMRMRGVKADAIVTTSAVRGAFKENFILRYETLKLMEG